jgi:hypothetical protein
MHAHSKVERRANILIVHFTPEAQPRATIVDHLYSFRRLSQHRCFYWNAALGAPPGYLVRRSFDLVIFHYSFMASRFDPPLFARFCDAMTAFKQRPVVKAIIVQDEQKSADVVNRFVNDWHIRHVFSCAASSEWDKIYPDVDRNRVAIHTVLTGYVSDHMVARIRRLARSRIPRTVDIGYRSWDPWPSLGRHGRLKGEIGHVFKREAPLRGLSVDISNDYADEFRGDDWYRFLLRCKYTIGVEGGASILDWDASVEQSTRAFMAEHPGATFEDVEAACFPGRDGELDYVALSPRHLECCATRTCQILVEGAYDGVLSPDVHYIPLRRDFSNIADVLELVERDDVRAGMVERAYRDVVLSGCRDYSMFVQFVLRRALPVSSGGASGRDALGDAVALLVSRCQAAVAVARWRTRDAGGALVGEDRFHLLVVGTKNIARLLRNQPLIEP